MRPDKVFKNIKEVTPEALSSLGIRCLLLDMDNTLSYPHQCTPFPGAERCVSDLVSAGVSVLLVSNNNKLRTVTFANLLNIGFVYRAMKPLPLMLWYCSKKTGIPLKETALLGDQVFTDVLGARFAGIRSLYIKPKVVEKGWFFKLKRKAENKFLSAK